MTAFSLIKSFGQDFTNSPQGIQTIISQTAPPGITSLSAATFTTGARWYVQPTNQWYIFGDSSWTLQNTGGGTNQPLTWVTVNTSQGLSTNTGYIVIPTVT